MRASFVPPYVLRRIAESDDRRFAIASRTAVATLERPVERTAAPPAEAAAPGVPGPRRLIGDARNGSRLPGVPVRREGDRPTGDAAVDEAYDGFGATYALLATVYGRDSLDGRGLRLDGTVHYERDYDNAFWDGRQMVFGDGDGQVFRRFTVSLSVIGHELAHGLVQYTAGLGYRGQAGALNESVADVFGVLVEQYRAQQTAEQADWLVGAGLFTDRVHGAAMRSMQAPGTAYDDPVLGRDPQPGHMTGYVNTREDDGGVHINSGIPNRAFYLVATALGGNAWERAGRIWYDTLTGPGLPGSVDFAGFAAATVRSARRRYGAGSAEERAVVAGWAGVGIDSPAAAGAD